MRAAGGRLTVTQGLCRPQGCGEGAPPRLPPHLSGPTGKPPGSLWTLKHGQMAQEVPAGHDHSSPSPASSLLMEAEVTLAGHTHEKAEGLLRAHSGPATSCWGLGTCMLTIPAHLPRGLGCPRCLSVGEPGGIPPLCSGHSGGGHSPTQGSCGVDSPELAGGEPPLHQAGQGGPPGWQG
ncbi:unnamed protein product [Rangifer tarandus platyrhynchus]|uniref:Uncharacterized protein n=1 Tax=Rangifer tarandus platyrhynchus TaxID=3082113 RepID=A0ACB1MJZ6_RANTA